MSDTRKFNVREWLVPSVPVPGFFALRIAVTVLL